MPLNEAQGYHPTNLTEKQQREAMESLYGLTERPTMTPNSDISYEEREQMRQILARYDAKDAAASRKDFDLNKPPVGPYVYREFPFLMYNHATKQTAPARDHVERDQLIAKGWSTDPLPPVDPPEIPLTAAEHAEAEQINSKLTKKVSVQK